MLVSYIYNTKIHRMEKVYICENPYETALVEGRIRNHSPGQPGLRTGIERNWNNPIKP